MESDNVDEGDGGGVTSGHDAAAEGLATDDSVAVAVPLHSVVAERVEIPEECALRELDALPDRDTVKLALWVALGESDIDTDPVREAFAAEREAQSVTTAELEEDVLK